MSDDESPEAPAAEEAPPRRKKRARSAESTPAEKAPVRAAVTAPTSPASRWTTGHVAAALALGVALGGMGGYLFGKKADPSATAEGSNKAAGAKGQAPAAGAYVPLAAWTPREGPELAKVTIVEFSDFQ